VCRVEDGPNGTAPNVTGVDLTEDHNVESNEKERTRAVASGGAVAGRHIAVDGAEGMLQTLRSLGDVPHHSNDVVSAVPEVNVLELSPSFHPFVVLASDGIWHHRSSSQVCKEMFEKLKHSLEENETKELTCYDLLKVCQIYESDLKGWVKSTDAPGDDIVMSAFTVSGFDWKK
jgi:serine/threonine protein phosphatase PrpC